MKINFTDERPQDSDVLAFIVTKSTFVDFKFPLEKSDIIHATAKLARFEGAAGQSFLLINEEAGKLVRIVLLAVADGETADYQKAGGDIVAKVQTSGAKHIAVHGANLSAKAAAEVAYGATLRNWRMDKYLRNLEAMLIVTDGDGLFVLTGAGDVLEPEHDVTAIGSGGNYALAAARALMDSDLPAEAIARKAMAIAADICVYTNGNLTVERIAK